MRVIDLTHPMTDGLPVWPGDPAVSLTPAAGLEAGGCRLTRLAFGSHTGTHMDAPAHVLPQGAALDTISLEQCTGIASIVENFPPPAELDRYARADFLLFSTGWDRRWGKPGFFASYPVPERGLIEALSRMNLKGVGLDTPSPDAPDSHDLPHHRLLLEAGLVLIENLAGLAPLRGRTVPFCAFPLACAGTDGAPVRAAAFLEDEF